MKKLLFNTAHPLSESGKPIFIPFGEWIYDGKSRQRLDRAHGEAIANELNARVAKGDPGIPVYQGHPDVPELASKYPDKGALGWITKIELANESPDGRAVPGLALTVEWDRDPGKGFRWFSPYWLANERDGSTYIVGTIASIGLVNNPNIPEFRLANETQSTSVSPKRLAPAIIELAAKYDRLANEANFDESKHPRANDGKSTSGGGGGSGGNSLWTQVQPKDAPVRIISQPPARAQTKETTNMDIKEIIKILGLPEDATEEDVRTALKAGAQAIDDLAAERARAESSEDDAKSAKADAKSAKADKEKLEVELENEKKAHAASKTALANEKAARADMALDRAVAEKRIGETARETWKTRLVNEGDAAYAALANEKAPSTTDKAKGLVNECGEKTDSEKRKALVNEIMSGEKVGYDTAWQRAARRSPELFK